jgi:hypothetical protein
MKLLSHERNERRITEMYTSSRSRKYSSSYLRCSVIGDSHWPDHEVYGHVGLDIE